LLIGIIACIGLTLYFYYNQQHSYFFHDSTTQYESRTVTEGSFAQTLLQYYYFFSYWVEYYGVMTTTLYAMPQNPLILLPNESYCYLGVLISCAIYSFLPCSFTPSTPSERSPSEPTSVMSKANNFLQSLLLPQQKKMMIVFQDEYDSSSTSYYHSIPQQPKPAVKTDSPNRWDNYGSFVDTPSTSQKESNSPIDELTSYFSASNYHKKLKHEPFFL
jgi:hypothetical protein